MDSQLEKLIQSNASLYQLNPAWVKAIISTESQWNLYAVRYEVNYAYLYQPEKFAKSTLITLSTEIATQKMSWGLGQLMGALVREQGHTGLIPELVKPEINIKHLCIRLDHLKKISHTEDDIFAMYNAGPGGIKKMNNQYPNQAYVDKVKSYLSQYE